MVYPGLYARTAPDRPAVVMAAGGERVTYAQLDARSTQLARLLAARGLKVGDTVAILAENHPRYFEVYWAAKRSGLYLTAINRYLAPAEAAYIIEDSGTKALVTSAALAGTAAAAAAMVPGLGCRLILDGELAGFEPYEAALATQPATPLDDEPRGEVMLYSSGTTGRPKGIRRPLTGRSVDDPEGAGTSLLERAVFGMDETSVYLCPTPLYHAAGLQWSAGVHELGGTLVVLEKFDAEGMLAVIERERVSHTQVVPTMLVRVLKLPGERRLRYDLSSLRRVIHSAAPCPPDVKRAMIDWLGPIVDEYYASTEGAGLSYIGAADWLSHPGSVGRPLVGVPHVCADDGAELPAGEPGLLYFEQPAASFSYHGDPEKTRSSRHPVHPNWIAVGDVGYLDDEGYLYLTDRKSFMIISGGVNIYPAEIEACLVMHPLVADVAVFGLPDPEMGEYVHAVVQPAPGVAPSPELAEQLRAHARDALAHYKVPRVVSFRDELPRMPTGKLAKGVLHDEYRKDGS
ncbi:acyl-CoA synthetase [Frankia sp. CNm7]|uniref:acyl-CoA synthetase n=1 Tax=Frankia nepalensis TaxID=1836974 RepID=UPI0019325226|nr:acyl-CoA synthetase [Frankia nepalensis]MBL7524041.1 acyl-CoA synthetase [Frankia nepalensis]